MADRWDALGDTEDRSAERETLLPANVSATARNSGDSQFDPAPCVITRPLPDASPAGSCSQPRINSRSKRFVSDLSFAPHGLAADAGPACDFKVRQELGKFAFVFGDARESAQRMPLPGAAAGTFGGDRNQLAARHRDAARALAKSFEVDRQRPIAIQLAQSAYAIANTRQQDSELRPLRALEFRGRQEMHADAGDSRARGAHNGRRNGSVPAIEVKVPNSAITLRE